jgi:hypothetical protein
MRVAVMAGGIKNLKGTTELELNFSARRRFYPAISVRRLGSHLPQAGRSGRSA